MKKSLKAIGELCRPKSDKQKKIYGIVGIGVFILTVILILILLIISKREKASVQEETVIKKTRETGVTESGSIEVGTTTQSFDVDISEFTGVSSFSVEGMQNVSSVPGGNTGSGFMGGIMTFSSGSTSTSSTTDTRQLEIEEVYVEAGQEIKAGDPILKLTEDSVNSIRTELQEDVTAAKLVYDQALTTGRQTGVEAESNLKLNRLYDTYADVEYNQTVQSLQDTVSEKSDTLEDKRTNLAEYEEELTEKQELLEEEKKVLENAEFTANGTDRNENLYWWVVAWQTKKDAEAMIETLEDEIETLKEDIETETEGISSAETELALANKALEAGIIEANAQLTLRSYYAEQADEIYDVAIEQSEFSEKTAKEDYEDAQAKLQDFDDVIVEQVIYATGNGLITDVAVVPGDTLTQNMDLITMNDYDAVTITLSIEEEDIQTAAVGSQVMVTVAAFPDEVFTGKVTEIGDAEIDSNTNKTLYTVTITVENTNNLLYQDMTAEVTLDAAQAVDDGKKGE